MKRSAIVLVVTVLANSLSALAVPVTFVSQERSVIFGDMWYPGVLASTTALGQWDASYSQTPTQSYVSQDTMLGMANSGSLRAYGNSWLYARSILALTFLVNEPIQYQMDASITSDSGVSSNPEGYSGAGWVDAKLTGPGNTQVFRLTSTGSTSGTLNPGTYTFRIDACGDPGMDGRWGLGLVDFTFNLPEPTSLSLGLVAGAALLGMRRRRTSRGLI